MSKRLLHRICFTGARAYFSNCSSASQRAHKFAFSAVPTQRLYPFQKYDFALGEFRVSPFSTQVQEDIDRAVDDQPKETQSVATDKSETPKEEAPSISQEQYDALVAELDDFKVGRSRTLQSDLSQDKYRRALAETENTRRRMTKEIAKMKQFGIQGFCKDMLGVADILSLATESVPPEEVTDSNPHLKSLFEGLRMTEKELEKAFNRNGLFKLDPDIGSQFDPKQHEALFQQVVEGMEEGRVAIVTKIGYRLHERTLRPAVVGVSKVPA